MDYSTIIDRLTRDIRQYRIESQRFFTGDSQVPPEELRVQIRKRLTALIGQPQLSSVDQFRLGALESRYHSLTELFRRRMRDQDQAHQVPKDSGTDGAVAKTTTVDLGRESGVDEVERLYHAVYAEREKKIDVETFHAYLLDQVSEVRSRTGCDKVRFSVEQGGDKPKLKARPVRVRP